MQTRLAAVLLLLFCAATTRLKGQLVNDHFTNRTLLAGNSCTFTANLAGASIEDDERGPSCGAFRTRSVWFEWQPTEPIAVFVQAFNALTNARQFDALAIYASTNLTAVPSWSTAGLMEPACMPLLTGIDRPFVAFNAEPGYTYYIQVMGGSRGSVEFQFDASERPLILEDPRDLMVNPGGVALFKASAIWLNTPQYQWLRDGNVLPGETSAMLQITNVSLTDAAGYSIVARNGSASTTSAVARLIVSNPIAGPSLTIAPPVTTNVATLRFAGATGRAYRLESTTDFVAWAPELIVGSWPETSVVMQTNVETTLTVRSIAERKFFRAGRYIPANEVCNANLKRIRHAKELWFRDAHRSFLSDTPTLSDVVPYYKGGEAPRCPAGGFYAMNAADTYPSCSRQGHVLEEPR